MKLNVPARNLSEVEKLIKTNISGIIISIENLSVKSNGYFNLNELKEVCKLNNNKCSIFLNLNSFYMEKDLEKVKDFLEDIKDLNIEGIYFTDLCVLNLVKEVGLKTKLIYNPNTLITNKFDASVYLDNDIDMVCLSNEITLQEAKDIASNLNSNSFEVMIHGHLSLMFSKRKLLTNYMNFIKSNHNVRNNYDLYLKEELRNEKMRVLEENLGTSIYSGNILNSFKEFNELINNNVSNIRIDNIFMSEEETINVVKDYLLLANNLVNIDDLLNKYENLDSGFYYKETSSVKVGD